MSEIKERLEFVEQQGESDQPPDIPEAVVGFLSQARRRNPNPKVLVRISLGGVVFHVKGWGPKSSGMSFETLFGGMLRDFCRDICVQFLAPT